MSYQINLYTHPAFYHAPGVRTVAGLHGLGSMFSSFLSHNKAIASIVETVAPIVVGIVATPAAGAALAVAFKAYNTVSASSQVASATDAQRQASANQAPPDGWDETAFLLANPDVAKLVAAGTYKSGWAYYCLKGYAEKRPLKSPYVLLSDALAQAQKDVPNPGVLRGWIAWKYPTGNAYLTLTTSTTLAAASKAIVDQFHADLNSKKYVPGYKRPATTASSDLLTWGAVAAALLLL